MVFSSALFLLVYLPVVFILNYFVKKEYSNVLLLIASLLFYAWGEPYLVILMIISIVLNWEIGRIIEKNSGRRKQVVLIAGVVCNLGILVYYKYIGFVVSIINTVLNKEVFSMPDIALPIGISFLPFKLFHILLMCIKEKLRLLIN